MLNLQKLNWDDAKNYNLPTGKKINKATLLFAKIEDEKINEANCKIKILIFCKL